MTPKLIPQALALTALAALLTGGCAHHRKNADGPAPAAAVAAADPAARVPASPKNTKAVDLTALQAKMPSFRKLERIFRGDPARAADLPAILDQVRTDPQYSDIHLAYTRETYRALGVDDPFEWMQKNGEHYGALNSYIDPQEDGEPIWATTNRRLRAQEELTPEEARFTRALIEALDALPVVKGIVFRGARLEPEHLERYQEKKRVTELPFTSTSIDPQIARLFAENAANPQRVSVIFVVRARTGGPVSAFHPGNNHEVEVLLRPATSFAVDRVLWTRDRKSVYVFMTE